MTDAGRVEGAERLRSALSAAVDQLGDFTAPGRKAAELVLTAADRNVPRRTNYLAEHQTVTATAGVAAVTANAPYAAIVHARDPWLARAVDATTADVLAIYSDHIDDAVKGTQ